MGGEKRDRPVDQDLKNPPLTTDMDGHGVIRKGEATRKGGTA